MGLYKKYAHILQSNGLILLYLFNIGKLLDTTFNCKYIVLILYSSQPEAC